MLLFQHSALGRAAQTTRPAASQPTDKPANETVRQSEQRRRKEVPGTLLPGNTLKLTRYHRKKTAVLDLTPGLVFFWFRFFFPGDCKTKDLGTSRTNQPTEEQTHKQTNKQTNKHPSKERNKPSKQQNTERQTQPRRDRRNQAGTRA